MAQDVWHERAQRAPHELFMSTESGAVAGPEVGVGPWAGPWPDDDRYDLGLLREGDRRNVADEFRYWTVEAIVAELDTRRHPFHVAIENWAHDLNIGSVVRTANAFNSAGVHVVGRRRWNRRGAMVTDRYLHVHHHRDAEALVAWASAAAVPLIEARRLAAECGHGEAADGSAEGGEGADGVCAVAAGDGWRAGLGKRDEPDAVSAGEGQGLLRVRGPIK